MPSAVAKHFASGYRVKLEAGRRANQVEQNRVEWQQPSSNANRPGACFTAVACDHSTSLSRTEAIEPRQMLAFRLQGGKMSDKPH
jgi:hypothetical protein